MDARRRSPATLYDRPNSMGMGGMGTASRISPEGSMRSPGMYNSEYRNYNRCGYGHGQLRQFERRQPSPQKVDIFMEAGRMAAEYLVSKGLLPQSSLFGKLQNGSSKNHVGYNNNFRILDGDNMQPLMEGRTSALSRLGNVADEEGQFGKRYSSGYSSMTSKGYDARGRRHGSYKDAEWDQELGRSGTLSQKARASLKIDDCHANTFSGSQDEKQPVKDCNNELQSSPATELNPETDGVQSIAGDIESTLNATKSVKNESAVDAEKDFPPLGEVDPTEKSDDMETSKADGGVENGNTDTGMGPKEDRQIDLSPGKDDQTIKDNDLLSVCRFENVPRRTRSSMLAARGLKVDAHKLAEEEKTLENELPEELEAHGEDVSMHASSNDLSLLEDQETEPLDSENSKALATEEVPCVAFRIVEENIIGAFTIAHNPFMKHDEEKEEVHTFGRCSSTESGKKRPLADIDNNEGNKKPRELTLSDEKEPDRFAYSNSMTNHQSSHDQTTADGELAMLSADHKKLVDVSLFPIDEATTEFSEKELFPGSFKTCDLNRTETCDVNHSCNSDSVLVSSCTEDFGEQTPVDIEMSVSENYNYANKYSKCGFGGRDIEVIDLESEHDNKTFNNPQCSETGFTAHDGFPNDGNDISDAQDSYGFMLSECELLGNSIPTSSSVPGDMNPLHNDIGIHGGEGILGDDDSIYMSLGEIPISFLRAWQQPSQKFGKPF